MKYKVILKSSYREPAFLFDDKNEALDFMELAWIRRIVTEDSDYMLDDVTLKLVEED